MNMKKIYRIGFSILVLGAWLGLEQAQAGEITYTPQNPNFGGNPFNAAPLLNNALAINKFTAPPRPRPEPLTQAQQFARRLDASVLSRLTRILSGQIVTDEGDIQVGTINTGINTIEVIDTGSGTIIQITNNETGEVTTVEVPDVLP